jgi:hypothetical protein
MPAPAQTYVRLHARVRRHSWGTPKGRRARAACFGDDFCQPSALLLHPLIQSPPWTAAGADIAPTYQSSDRAELRAIGIGNPTGDEVGDAKPRGGDRQRPRNRRNRNTERCPRKREPASTGDYSGNPPTVCNRVRRGGIFANRALGAVRHFHRRWLATLRMTSSMSWLSRDRKGSLPVVGRCGENGAGMPSISSYPIGHGITCAQRPNRRSQSRGQPLLRRI